MQKSLKSPCNPHQQPDRADQISLLDLGQLTRTALSARASSAPKDRFKPHPNAVGDVVFVIHHSFEAV
jgi:hypothetical protein